MKKDDLAGTAEVAEICHISRQRVYQWSMRLALVAKEFPPPLVVLPHTGPIWQKSKVEEWYEENKGKFTPSVKRREVEMPQFGLEPPEES